MLASSVRDRLSPFGQAERRIDRNEVGLCLLYCVQYVFVAERDGRLRLHAAQKTHPRRPPRRPREIDPEHDKGFTGEPHLAPVPDGSPSSRRS